MASFDIDSAVCPRDCRALKSAIGDRTVTLASSSLRRRQILRLCGIPFQLANPTVEEPSPPSKNHRAWVRRWAMRKALSVCESVQKNPVATPTDLIFAADTIVVHRGRGLGKPEDERDATAMLEMLSGETHRVITGIAVASPANGQPRACSGGSAESRVRFRCLTKREICDYIATAEPFDKAGGYAIQGGAGVFVTAVDGPVDNVIGFPVRRLAQVTKRLVG